MFKKRTLKNKRLFFLLFIYSISHIFLYNNNFYINFLSPLFWLSFITIYYHNDLKLLNKKEINITITISIIFLILYIISGFIFGFTKNYYNHTFINILTNLYKVVLPIYGIEIIRYKLIKSNKNSICAPRQGLII